MNGWFWWAWILLIAAVVAAIFAYCEIVAGAEKIAKILFWICLILFFACIAVYTYTVPFRAAMP